MYKEGSIFLFHYWNRLRGSRLAPRRTEIEPADIKTLLADTFILEQDGRGEAVFRLAGTRLCATYGQELKGFAFSSLWAEKDQPTIRRLTRHLMREKAVIVVVFEGFSSQGRLNGFELLMLPLQDSKEGARALGTVQSFTKPFWLGSDPIQENRIGSFRLLDPDREYVLPEHRPAVPEPLLASSGAFALQTSGRRIGHLLVYEGGRSG
ncbi:PAS domain-containing protein [Chelativorans sp. Marseille-P2723]|uniref:PAS domain-containing protein n=1 Tax=Chelativorans sp. Marseille-P2723 TaxID=2709133 RepID=UPI00156E7098|nr:PAS domain-containing protein [Chelativorans sp. Marseille-P2723]